MPPHFNLQNVLDVRHKKVEALEIELGQLLLEQQKVLMLLNSLKDLQTNLMEQFTQAMVGDIDLFTISVMHNNLNQISDHITGVEGELKRAEYAVEAKRKQLVEARQAEETLQILKRKKIEEYNAELAQYEAKVQDDIYIARAFRQQRQEVA